MKELVFHRLFFPAMERWADRWGSGRRLPIDVRHSRRSGASPRPTGCAGNSGSQRDDRFAVMACNGHEYLELYHAGFLGAGIINPLNLRLAGEELQFILADSGTEVVFVDAVFAEHFARNIAPVRADLPLRHVVLMGDGDVPHDVRYEELHREQLARRSRRTRGDRPGRTHVHRRHDRPAQGCAARAARRAVEPLPHRHRRSV